MLKLILLMKFLFDIYKRYNRNYGLSFLVVRYNPVKINIDAIIIVKLNVSDLENIANATPIIGCRYIKTATSVDVNLVSA